MYHGIVCPGGSGIVVVGITSQLRLAAQNISSTQHVRHSSCCVAVSPKLVSRPPHVGCIRGLVCSLRLLAAVRCAVTNTSPRLFECLEECDRRAPGAGLTTVVGGSSRRGNVFCVGSGRTWSGEEQPVVCCWLLGLFCGRGRG